MCDTTLPPRKATTGTRSALSVADHGSLAATTVDRRVDDLPGDPPRRRADAVDLAGACVPDAALPGDEPGKQPTLHRGTGHAAGNEPRDEGVDQAHPMRSGSSPAPCSADATAASLTLMVTCVYLREGPARVVRVAIVEAGSDLV